MTEYEERIERRRERYAQRSEKKRAEAKAANDTARGILDHIPMGQPVLVGHHSERRHRRDLERVDRSTRKAIDADRAAAHYADKAENYGTHGVSSDDPEAVVKLRAKLTELETKRDRYKAHNKKARAEGGDQLPSYVLKNLGANIRRYRKRLEELEKASERVESEPIEGDGFRVEEDKGDNRVRFYFDARPDKETCRKMKGAGFRWARSVGAWQRQLNNAGVHAAKRMARELFGREDQS